MIEETSVLGVLDSCAQSFSFPMLDNGYIYPAGARLSVFGDREDWAIVIETFGYSPRAHVPTLNVETFASRLHNRQAAAAYYSDSGDYETHVRANPHNESVFFTPLEDGPWIDIEHVAAEAAEVTFRGERTRLPALSDYEALGIAVRIHAASRSSSCAEPSPRRDAATCSERTRSGERTCPQSSRSSSCSTTGITPTSSSASCRATPKRSERSRQSRRTVTPPDV